MKYRRWPSYQAWRESRAPRGIPTITIRANQDTFTVAGTVFMIDDNGDVVPWVPLEFMRAFDTES